ncbi:diguanylate cyclase domain-containing protein [Variovorax sp. RT4R15]|uniref:diguanylate cyclase domain-containing protein n=1 Tax=Variovorax sp. RT4R15 TaxID=3443737 RepID=UPI003F48BE9E
MRISDTVARLGGDEFVVVLEQLHNNEEAELIASKIVAAMQAPIVLARGTVTSTASIGVGLLRDDDEASSPGRAHGRRRCSVVRRQVRGSKHVSRPCLHIATAPSDGGSRWAACFPSRG